MPYDNLFEKAKTVINDYSLNEFGDEASFKDPENIGIAYTTFSDLELDVQVIADLVNLEIRRYVCGILYDKRRYSSMLDFIEYELCCLEFDELTCIDSIPVDILDQLFRQGSIRNG